jgi:hypothetical protein
LPASRSRTEQWRDSLLRIQDRGGALEISVARPTVWLPSHGVEVPQPGGDIVWRVKVIRATSSEIVVEPPAAFGETIHLQRGVELIGALTVGQNRWMFHTRTLGEREERGPGGKVLVLAMPENVERCTRRHFYRISTANLHLPDVQCWPLLNPASVVAAEAANRVQIESVREERESGKPTSANQDPSEPILLPDVGPMFTAKLVNMGGGGLGLRLGPNDAGAIEHRPYFWLRVDLRPHIPAPLAVTARLVHTHIDSSQNLYAGLAFDFSQSPEHRRFIVDQIGGYVTRLQSEQKRPAAAAA